MLRLAELRRKCEERSKLTGSCRTSKGDTDLHCIELSRQVAVTLTCLTRATSYLLISIRPLSNGNGVPSGTIPERRR